MEEVISITIAAIVSVTLIVVGLDVSPAEFRRLLRNPRPVMAGFFGMFLLVPLAIGVTRLFSAPADIETGVLLVAICPTGNLSNLYVFLSRGNTALSLTMCISTSLAAFLTMPFWMWAYGVFTGESFAFQVPASLLVVRLFFLLALPVGLGMWLKAHFPRFEQKFHRILRTINVVLIIGLGVFIIGNESESFAENIGPTALLAVTFSLLAMIAGFLLSRVSRLGMKDSLTLMLVFPVRNMGIAIALAVTIFHNTQFAVFATAMFMSQIPFFIGAALLIRRHHERNAAAG